MSILKVEENMACPVLKNVEMCKMFLGCINLNIYHFF